MSLKSTAFLRHYTFAYDFDDSDSIDLPPVLGELMRYYRDTLADRAKYLQGGTGSVWKLLFGLRIFVV